ncbi:hypothetical protein GSI_04433 [Ganoderma sinense ZZ0214-1]|uniref:F-box domain-containing protein n=1 Tax=Ganoderma sinense ZZ0214-1 TaxID=1077348 RepID=A0A2G8SJT7_9APHY|nr:hypothetical protein GSI_04433 [Ganoderma sinense ZZ0214-1]
MSAMSTPQSGKARVLSCPAVLTEIFNHLEPGRCTPKERRTTSTIEHLSACRRALLMSALTCRTLSDIALDVLWQVLNDIRPLLRLLPTYERPLPVIVLRSQIMPVTWARFQSYAARVREVGYSPKIKQVHPSVWTFLAVKYEGSPLLPRLCRLDAPDLSPDNLSPLLLLLSPSLRSLSLSFGEKSGSDVAAPEVIAVALQHATQAAPRVESFHISGHNSFTRKHLSILQRFAELTELSLGATFLFDQTMIRQLSTTTFLRTLAITIGQVQPSTLELLANNFQSLNRLTLRGDLNNLVNFILAFSLPHLDSLTLHMHDCNDPKAFSPRFASMCQHLGLPKSLKHIDLRFCSGMLVQRQETLSQYLEPLLLFPKVERCNLIFYNTAPSVCDEDLIRLGDAWPNLQHLNFEEFTTDNERYGRFSKYGHLWCNAPDIQHPTMVGLTELARRCPTLRYLHLVTADVGTLPAVDAVSTLDHPLEKMLFDHVHNAASSGEKRCAAAEVLDAAFPKLSISRSAGHRLLLGRPETRHQWRRILMLMRIMRRQRKHPKSDADEGAGQSLADLNVDRELTDSDPEEDAFEEDGAMDLDSDSAANSEGSQESDGSEEVDDDE